MPLIGNAPSSYFASLRPIPSKFKPLPVFPNPDFEDDFDGWDTINKWISPNDSAKTTNNTVERNLLGCPVPGDPTPYPIGQKFGSPGPSPGQALTFSGSFNTKIVSGGPTGKYAELSMSGTVSPGGSTVYGPALTSKNPVVAEVGDRISFNWTAQGGGDAYNVLAYIINPENCKYFIMLDATGDSPTATTPWTTVSKVIQPGEEGNYFFVFLCGTFDYTFYTGVGAKLGVDSIKIDKAGTY